MRPIPVLLTRPEADSEAVAEKLRDAGAQVIVSPLMRIETAGELPDLPGGVLLTSRNAVAAYVARMGPAGLRAWVVGPGTAEAARAAGLRVEGIARDVDELTILVPDDAPPLVHLRGAVTRGDLAARLRARGLRVMDAVIYRQVEVALSQEAARVLRDGPTLVPLYSPRSATLLGRACPTEAMAHLRLLALSPAVAEACPVPPIAVSETPDGKAMLRLALEKIASMDG